MLDQLRQYRRRTATQIGLAFACAWLAFAAVPCSAMPQSAMAHGHAMGAAMGAAMTHAMPMSGASHDCPHCPPSATTDKSAGDCSGLDSAVVTKITTFDLTLAAPQALPMLAPVLDDGCVVASAPHSHAPPPSVPLNLRYCTFIE